MDYLYICNTASDYISKVALENFKEEKITLCNKSGSVGPHGMCCSDKGLIIANSYSNSISKVDLVSGIETDYFYIGRHCNDVRVYRGEAYVTCGESNTIVGFDLEQNKVIEELPSGNNPHNIDINSLGLLAVSNMEGDSIIFIDCSNKEYSKEVKVGPYPLKIKFSEDGDLLYVCESNIGSDKSGSISIISIKTMSIIKRIYVGLCPVDMHIENEESYVSNFNEGNISILNCKEGKEVRKIDIGGMPRGIVKKGKYIYVGDNYNNLLVRLDVYNEGKKVIAIGKEPTGMTLA